MERVIVSIIMPAFNVENFISESIESVIAQTITDWELIIIDDGSTDATAEKIKFFIEKDRRIQYYFQQNGRQGKARNRGISLSRGKFIAFLDADDLWDPKKLEIQLIQMESANADLIFSDCSLIDENSNVTRESIGILEKEYYGQNSLIEFFHKNRASTLTVLCKRECLIKVGGFSEAPAIQNAEDYHLWMKLLLSGCFLKSYKCVLAAYREHASQTTSDDNLASRAVIHALIDLNIDKPDLIRIRDMYICRWIVTFFSKNSLQADIDDSILKYLSGKFKAFLLLTKLFPLTNQNIKNRLIIKFCWNFSK